MNKIKVSFCTLILMLSWITDGWAQFDPSNPQEPYIQYKIELECTPQGVAGLSGQGSFPDGSYVYINTYPYNYNYRFLYWEYNGEVYSRNSEFLYRINTRDVKFIAHYEYQPYNPDEPNAHFMRRMYLKSQPEGVASFNISNGQKFELGSTVWVYETGRNWQYEFKGWYEGDKLVSNDVEFVYTIPDRDVTLTAHYEFNPNSPDDPGSFYSTSCDFLAEPNDMEKGLVSVEGLEKGRAVFGNWVTLTANPIGDNTFCGWYMGDSLLSVNSNYSFYVPYTYNRIYIVADFKYKPHKLTYKINGETYASFVEETGSEITSLPGVVRDGYTFSGWQGVPDVMPDNDVVVTSTLKLTDIRISKQDIELNGGEKQRLSVYVGSSSLEEVTDIIWETGNHDIATITANGVIKGVGKGITNVTATLRSDTQVLATTTVNVISDDHTISLPPVGFEFNYNAVNYDAGNNRIANDPDAILFDNCLQLNTNIPGYDGKKLTISRLCRGYIDKWAIGSEESGQYFKRTGNDTLTIICKVKPRFDNSSNKSDLISINTTTGTSSNYSLRLGYRNAVYLATRNSYASRFIEYKESSDMVFAIRANGSGVIIQNLTTGETKVLNGNTWGSTEGSMNFFYSNSSNYFVGDFYWAYLSKNHLTDSEIWNVVDYNDEVDDDYVPDLIWGDANNSGVVNVTDITTVLDFMFGNYPPVFNYKASDVNMSREINVADIAGIVNLIYGLPATHHAPARVKGMTFSNGVIISSPQIAPGGEGIITVNVSNAAHISAAEMNLRLPQGLTVIDAEIDGDDDRVFRSGYVDGCYKMVTYSMENKTLSGNDGALITLKVKASQDIEPALYDISVTDIVLSGNGDEIKVEPIGSSICVEGETTLVPDTESIIEIRTYDLVGREVAPNSIKNGPYIVREFKDGKVVRTYKVIR